jgi:hypothetical protein
LIMTTNPLGAVHKIDPHLSPKIPTIDQYQRLLKIKSVNFCKAKEQTKRQGT